MWVWVCMRVYDLLEHIYLWMHEFVYKCGCVREYCERICESTTVGYCVSMYEYTGMCGENGCVWDCISICECKTVWVCVWMCVSVSIWLLECEYLWIHTYMCLCVCKRVYEYFECCVSIWEYVGMCVMRECVRVYWVLWLCISVSVSLCESLWVSVSVWVCI